MIKVIVDALGADNPIEVTVEGALKAIKKDNDVEVTIVGPEKRINEQVAKSKIKTDLSRLVIVDAKEEITNNDVPTMAVRTKLDSSLVKSIDMLRQNEKYAGLVSCGSTGAVLTSAFMRLGRLSGVSRPAICPTLPTVKGGKVSIIDSGANMDCKPINLFHFTLMANVYLREVLKIQNPRIALLSVGNEDGKGNELTKEVFKMLKERKDINFVGNMEARYLLSGDYDLIVADGFACNVLLKSAEGAVQSLLQILKQNIKKSFLSIVGSIFMRGTFKKLKTTMSYHNHGGAVLLGCKKIVVKVHGSCSSDTVFDAIEQVIATAKANYINKLEKVFKGLDSKE